LQIHRYSRLFFTLLLLSLTFARVGAEPLSTEEASTLLPDTVGEFRAQGPAAKVADSFFEQANPADFGITSAAERLYVSKTGQKFRVTLLKARNDSAAYALLTSKALRGAEVSAVKPGDAWTAGLEYGHPLFFKGAVLVSVTSETTAEGASTEQEVAFARLFAGTLDRGENEIPVLVKHLPEAETAAQRAAFVVSQAALQEAAGRRPALEAVSFEGGAEAVTTTYGPSRLVIVENTTPQLATTNDARINAKLKELSEAGQPQPSAYRRVGNYSVFVFDAPDEATAAKLIDGIKYEQVVQWLGNNPYALRRAQREYTETTAGVILAVLKASGLSLLLCLGAGAIFGGLIFKRRRHQQATQEAFSDAGGMLRLNLDEMTQHYDAAKMLGPGEQR
jgi:hypothetical protein